MAMEAKTVYAKKPEKEKSDLILGWIIDISCSEEK